MSRTAARTAFLCIAIALLILSDCQSLLGQWAVNLKYAGLIVLAIMCVFDFVKKPVLRGALACGLVAFGVLVALLPFQTGEFSIAQSLGLYAMVFLLACLSGQLIQDARQLAVITLFALGLVILMLLLSYQMCLDQLSFYTSIGRPRFKGCFSNPNSLGGITTMIILMLVVARRGRGLRNGPFAAALIIAVLLLLGSGSRTAWLATAGMFVILWTVSAMLQMRTASARVLTVIAGVTLVVLMAIAAISYLSNDLTFQYRLRSLLAIDLTDPQTLVGIGYVSSEGISQLTEAAGGATDMLYVSLVYRVGIIGSIAYVLYVAAALASGRKSRHSAPIVCALLAYIVLQGIGESYLSSVMSFVSAFDWVMLACASGIVAQAELTEGEAAS